MLLISSSFLVILISVTPPSYVSPHSVVVLQPEGPFPGDPLADLPWPSLLLVSTLPRSWFFEQSLSLSLFFLCLCALLRSVYLIAFLVVWFTCSPLPKTVEFLNAGIMSLVLTQSVWTLELMQGHQFQKVCPPNHYIGNHFKQYEDNLKSKLKT